MKGPIQTQPRGSTPPTSPPLTNYNSVVIGNKQFAVNVDELRDQFSFQLRICPKSTEGYVVYPLISNWKLRENKTGGMREVEERREIKDPLCIELYE